MSDSTTLAGSRHPSRAGQIARVIEYDRYGYLDETWFTGSTPEDAMARAIEYFHDMRW